MTSRFVAPLVGAWIEIVFHKFISWYSDVAPLVGAWIEIKSDLPYFEEVRRRSSCRSVD